LQSPALVRATHVRGDDGARGGARRRAAACGGVRGGARRRAAARVAENSFGKLQKLFD
jgi:hypothetical protein